MTDGFRQKKAPTKKQIKEENTGLKVELIQFKAEQEEKFKKLVHELQETLGVFTNQFGTILAQFKKEQTSMGFDVEKINYLTASIKRLLDQEGVLPKDEIQNLAESLRLEDFNKQAELQDKKMELTPYEGPVEKETYVTFSIRSVYPEGHERAGEDFEPLCVYRSRSWVGATPPDMAETLDEQLMGMSAGDTKTFEWEIKQTEFPEIAGQKLSCTIQVFDIKKGEKGTSLEFPDLTQSGEVNEAN